MEWKSKNDEIDYMGIKFESWKINCNNINDNKLSSVILPKNASEYLFTDLGNYSKLINVFYFSFTVILIIVFLFPHCSIKYILHTWFVYRQGRFIK